MYVHFKWDLLDNQHYDYFNIILYIAFLYLTSIPVNLWKIAPIIIAMVIFTKKSGNALFKLREYVLRQISISIFGLQVWCADYSVCANRATSLMRHRSLKFYPYIASKP